MRMFFLTAFASICVAPALATAGETQIVGTARNKSQFTVETLGPFPGAVPLSQVAGEDAATGPIPYLWRVRVSVLKRPAGGKRADPADTVSHDSQCVMVQNRDVALISCARSVKNELSGVIYRETGTDRNGEPLFTCVSGCSSRVPTRLRTVGLESGC